MSAGKGDSYRKVDGGKYRDNWDKAFSGKINLDEPHTIANAKKISDAMDKSIIDKITKKKVS